MDRNIGAITAALNPASYPQQVKSVLHVEFSQMMTRYASLTVRCYSHNLNRTNVNLVQVEGVISVFYKKVKYNIPITMLYPQRYPNEAPTFYVIPTQTMMLNLNNKSVSQDGKISLQVLNRWKNKPATLDILEEARKLFEKDIPLFSTTGVVQVQSFPPQQNGQVSNPPASPAPSSSGLIKSTLSAISSIFSSGSSSNQSSAGINQNSSKSSVNSSSNSNAVVPVNSPPQPAPGSQPVHPIYSNPSSQAISSPNTNLSSHSIYSTTPTSTSTSTLASSPTPVPACSMFPLLLSSSQSSQPLQSNPLLPSQSSSNKPEANISKIKLIYLNRLKELKDEVLILEKEKEGLIRNREVIDEDLMSYSGQLNQIDMKKKLMKASIENTEEWIEQVKTTENVKLDEDDIVEYRNEFAKEFLKSSAKEKALESLVMVIIDCMNKKQVSFKEGIPKVKALYADLFIASRMKDKVLSLS